MTIDSKNIMSGKQMCSRHQHIEMIVINGRHYCPVCTPEIAEIYNDRHGN